MRERAKVYKAAINRFYCLWIQCDAGRSGRGVLDAPNVPRSFDFDSVMGSASQMRRTLHSEQQLLFSRLGVFIISPVTLCRSTPRTASLHL